MKAGSFPLRETADGADIMLTLFSTKALLKITLVSFLPLAAAGAPFAFHRAPGQAVTAIETVTLAPAEFSYRVAGDFSRGRMPVNAPLVRSRLPDSLVIMKAEVSEADFGRCVQDGACRVIAQAGSLRSDVPVTGVSWEDAIAYAQWLSGKTGEVWRLPTDEEWVFAAGSRAKDDAIETDTTDFSQRWLAKYEQESARERNGDRRPRTTGSFGINEHGLLDVAGNVWEWTDTCFIRHDLDSRNRPVGEATTNCGVRVVQGAHRSYVSSFIRDARGGGCSTGTPPDNLGFRLVRDDRSWLKRMVGRAFEQLKPAA